MLLAKTINTLLPSAVASPHGIITHGGKPIGKKATIYDFEVVLEAEEKGGYHVYAPSLKGCHSYGETREEALRNITEAIELWLESAKDLGIPASPRLS